VQQFHTTGFSLGIIIKAGLCSLVLPTGLSGGGGVFAAASNLSRSATFWARKWSWRIDAQLPGLSLAL